MRKKIYFIAPKNKGGTYFYYQNLFKYLKEHHWDELEVHLCNTFFSYIKLHFLRADYIFSIIPFFFKPLFTYKYFYNLHGNYKEERKNKSIWVKLLYLSELNLFFSDKIILTSYYLAHTLKFSKSQLHKTIILKNYVLENFSESKFQKSTKLKFLTITSFDFKKKWEGVINLLNVIQRLWNELPDENISFTIVWKKEWDNYQRIYDEFENMVFSKNTVIRWTGWLSEIDLEKEFLSHDTFLYWSMLDNTPGVLLEAMNYKRKIYVNNFESFSYILPWEAICDNEDIMFNKILKDTICINKYRVLNVSDVWEHFYNLIK